MKRQAGILLPIFSLPNKYGIGSFGKQAYKFIDFLKSAGQKVWQILPLVQTGFGNSPYSSVCSYSFNPYFIDLDLLVEQGLLTKEEIKSSIYDGEYINYSFSLRQAIPGRTLPSKSSNDAPPPVEMCDILSAKPS